MTAQYVQVATDGTGKKVQTFENVISGNTVEAQAIVQVDTSGIEVMPYQTIFYDSWSTSLDTTDKWTVTGNAPTVSAGTMTMSATVSSYNTIRTKDNTRSNAGYTFSRNGITLETSAATGCGRFWGLGTNATTPAAAVLVQDGIGFEIDQAAGTLLAVTYAAGVRTTVATLTRPSDGAAHGYGLFFRVTAAYWVIDNVNVATVAFPNVQNADLPALIVRQNASSFTGTPVFSNLAHLTADTSKPGFVVSDPIIGARQARVKGASTAAVAADPALVVAISPNTGAKITDGTNFLPTGDAAARGIFTKTTDGTNTVAVKAASTAAVATDPSLVVALHPTSPMPTGTNTIGSVKLTDGTTVPVVKAASTAAAAGDTALVVSLSPNSPVVQSAITKGTQGTTGVTTQDLKDAGRVALMFTATAVAAGATGTETAISLTKAADTGATSSAASFVITSGKRFRITSLCFASLGNATATAQNTVFHLRANTAGAVTTTSTPLLASFRTATPATSSAYDRFYIPLPDGYEILGNGTIQFGVTAVATYTTNAPTWDVSITGFEY